MKKVLSLTLVLCMLFSLMPATALAQEGEALVVGEGSKSLGGLLPELPAETEMPEEPAAPAETESPVETEAPAETEVPEESEAPAEPETPAETEEPVPDAGPAEDVPEAELDGASSGSCGTGVNWSFNSSTGTLTISGSGAMADYANGLSVPWNSYRSSIQSIVVGSGVTGIGNYVFYGPMMNLTSISLPDGLKTIGLGAFGGCRNVTSLTLPDSLTSIATDAFTSMTSLQSFRMSGSSSGPTYKIVNGLLCMGSTLVCCPQAKSGTIYVPSSVSVIGEKAFWGCANLTEVRLPKGLTSIGENAFSSCSGLTALTIPEGDDGSMIIYGWAFNGCSNLKTLRLTGSSYFIESTALPSGVITTVEGYDSHSVIYRGTGGQSYKMADFAAHLGASYVSLGYDAGQCGDNLTWVLSNDGTLTVSGIGAMWDSGSAPWGYYGPARVKKAILPENMTTLGNCAFSNCTVLETVVLRERLTSIGQNAFTATAIRDLIVPKAVTAVGDYAFSGLKNTAAIRFQGDAPSFGANSFYGTTATIYYPPDNDTWTPYVGQQFGGNLSWVVQKVTSGLCGDALSWSISSDEKTLTITGSGAMWDWQTDTTPWAEFKDTITKVYLPSGLTYIGSFAFNNCTNWTGSLYLPSSLTGLGSMAFDRCGLSSVYFQSNPTEFGINIFSYCQNLAYVRLPEGMTEIPPIMFNGCTALQSIELPATIQKLGAFAFSGSGLTSIRLPKALTGLDTLSLSCSSLQNIYFEGTAPIFNGEVFEGTTATAWYPAGDSWTEEVRQNYGGSITWKPAVANYTVKHHQQNVTGSGYTLDSSKTLSFSGVVGSMTTAAPVSYPGFTVRTINQQMIKSDGTTVVNIYYERNVHTVTINAGRGIASVTGAGQYRYGSEFVPGAVLKPGYEGLAITGGQEPSEGRYYMPDRDVSYEAGARLSAPVIGTQPESIQVSYGDAASLSVAPVMHDGLSYSYEWSADTPETEGLVLGATASIDLPVTLAAGSYSVLCEVTVSDGVESCSVSSNAVTVTVTKADQSISLAGLPLVEAITNSSVRLQPVVVEGGVGTVEYALGDADGNITGAWQTDTLFSGLDRDTNYFFYVRYAGDANYNPLTGGGTMATTGNQYTIRFDANGGSDTPEDMVATYGTVWVLPTAEREGYRFDGWHTAASGGMPFTETNQVQSLSDDMLQLYARWTKLYTIRFDLNAGEGTVPENIVGPEGDSVSLPTPGADFSRPGYDFLGWNTAADGSGTNYPAGTALDNLSEDLSLYAQWKANKASYTVRHHQQTFYSEAYYEVESDRQILTGEIGALTDAEVKTYTGFTAKAVEQQTIAADGSTVVDIYYDRNVHTVTVTAGRGISAVTGSGQYRYGADVSPTASLKPGYGDMSWSGDVEMTGGKFTMPDEDVSLTATAALAKPSISAQPNEKLVHWGQNYMLEIAPVTISGLDYSFQWHLEKGETDELVGGNTSYYLTPADLAVGEYEYYCVVTVTDGMESASTASGPISYVVEALPLTVSAQNQTISYGNNIQEGLRWVATGMDELREGDELAEVALRVEGDRIVPGGAKILDAEGKDVTAGYAITYESGALTVTQAIPPLRPAAPTVKSLTTKSVELHVIPAETTEYGPLEYGVLEKGQDIDQMRWQASPLFEGLTTGAEYIFRARYAGTENYHPALSDSLEVKLLQEFTVSWTDGEGYTITATKNGESFASGDKVTEEDTLVFTAMPMAGYGLGDFWLEGDGRLEGNVLKQIRGDITVGCESFLWGDADGNGKVNARDATVVLRFDARVIGETELNMAAADVDGNGNVNARDATYILRKDAGVITQFPAEA